MRPASSKPAPAIPLTLHLYRGLGHMLSPLMPFLLQRRLARGKEDAGRIDERLGHPGQPRPEGVLVWLHAASVGETASVIALVQRLVASGRQVVLTTGTVTSAALAASRLQKGAIHQYVPLDTPGAARRFLDHWRPDLAIFCESELWPGLVVETLQRRIPLGLVNGRMSARSARRWARFPATARALLGNLAFCLAQSAEDCARFERLGADAMVSGNLKFDTAALPIDGDALLRLEKALRGRPMFLAASTHPGEEEMVLEAAGRIRESVPDLLTVLVPRHPARGEEIAATCAAGGLVPARRSRGDMPDDMMTLYLADTLGELGLFFSLASVVFMGGSLVPIGGHNPIEPARLGAPILHGRHTDNFQDIYSAFDEDGAAILVRDTKDLADTAARLIADPRARALMTERARRLVEAGKGGLETSMRAIDALLPIENFA
jgi:3-deoxy-D-manno-octulosonic-acid transferase